MANLVRSNDDYEGGLLVRSAKYMDDQTVQLWENGQLVGTRAWTAAETETITATANIDGRRTRLDQARSELRKIAAGTSGLTAAQRERLIAASVLRLVNEALDDATAGD